MGDVIVTNKDSEYKWKMNRLMNDSPSSPNFPPDAICIPSGSVVDCLSQVQSDMINIDDSVSQVADRVANREREQVAKTMTIITPNNSLLPKTLLEIGSQVRLSNIADYKRIQNIIKLFNRFHKILTHCWE